MTNSNKAFPLRRVVAFLKHSGSKGLLTTLPSEVTWSALPESGYFALTDLKGLVSVDATQEPLTQELAFLRKVREYPAYLTIGKCSEEGVRTGLLVTNGRVYRVVYDSNKGDSFRWPDAFSLLYKEG